MESISPELIESIKVIVRQELEAAGVGCEALSKVEAARRLGMSVRTLDREISARHINTVQTRGRQKITVAEISAYLERSSKRRAA